MGRGTANGLGQGLHDDLTTTGARCISSLPCAAQGGRGVLRLGDVTTPCPKCGKPGEIITSLPAMKWDGIPTVLDGAELRCGCPPGTNRLIAPRDPPYRASADAKGASPVQSTVSQQTASRAAPVSSPGHFAAPAATPRSPDACVFAKSCVSVPAGSTAVGTNAEPAGNFGATALLASTGAAGAAGNLGRVAGTLGGELGSWTVGEVAAGAAARLSLVLLALWPRDIGDATLYAPEQLANMRSASTRVRFQFRRDASGTLQVYGLHTSPGSGTDRVPVTQATWNANKSAMVAVLDGITITWTPNNGPVVNLPTPYPGIPERLDTLLVHPIAPGRETQISHYPGPDADNLTWQDTIITFPADSGVAPLYLVFSQPVVHKPPKTLEAFPSAIGVKFKTSVQGGGGVRKRWKDQKGKIYEWDSQHGAVEVYDKQGRHLGEFNPNTGEQTKPAKPGRRVEK